MYRICFTVDSSYVGGAERYVELLAANLDRERFVPSILAHDAAGLSEWLGRVEGLGVRVRTVRMGVPFRPTRAGGIVRAMRDLAPDVVHVNMPGPYDGQMGLLAPLARFAGARRVVTTEHLPMVERLWKRALVKGMAMQFVDHVLTVSRANVPYLVERQGIQPDKIKVVYNGIPNDFGGNAERAAVRAEYGLGDGDIAIVIVGAISERKGLGVLIDALAAATDSRWRLFVVGQGPERARFETQAADRGVSKQVRFVGQLGERDIQAFLPAMDVLALPSFMEGLPYVIVEAMACSLPVVATHVYGIVEAAPHGDAALLVPPGDVDLLKNSLMLLIESADMRQRLGARGRSRFEELFTLDRHLQRMQTIYTELLEG